MNTFHSNIISIYGEKGKAWLDELNMKFLEIAKNAEVRITIDYAAIGYHKAHRFSG